MNIAQHFWRYWKWLCVALVTTAVVLFLLATLVNFFKSSAGPDTAPPAQCIDQGGTWNAEEGRCQFPA